MSREFPKLHWVPEQAQTRYLALELAADWNPDDEFRLAGPGVVKRIWPP
jgi:hypothetical protein